MVTVTGDLRGCVGGCDKHKNRRKNKFRERQNVIVIERICMERIGMHSECKKDIRIKKHMRFGSEWLDRLFPEGLPVLSSTIISGPGGSGKPLVGTNILAAWIKSDRCAVAFPLNSDWLYAEKLLQLYDVPPEKYRDRVVFVDLAPEQDSVKPLNANVLAANILKPDLLHGSIDIALDLLACPRRDVILYGSALNILFFSPTWRDRIFEEWKKVLFDAPEFTSVFSVSTSAFQEKIRQFENLADNLMYARMEKPMTLYLQVAKVKGAPFDPNEFIVPLAAEVLASLRDESGGFRKRIIPIISRI
jgi:hypothetical protein